MIVLFVCLITVEVLLCLDSHCHPPRHYLFIDINLVQEHTNKNCPVVWAYRPSYNLKVSMRLFMVRTHVPTRQKMSRGPDIVGHQSEPTAVKRYRMNERIFIYIFIYKFIRLTELRVYFVNLSFQQSPVSPIRERSSLLTPVQLGTRNVVSHRDGKLKHWLTNFFASFSTRDAIYASTALVVGRFLYVCLCVCHKPRPVANFSVKSTSYIFSVLYM